MLLQLFGARVHAASPLKGASPGARSTPAHLAPHGLYISGEGRLAQILQCPELADMH